MDIKEKLDVISEHYGLPAQMDKTIEEQTELVRAITAWTKAAMEHRDTELEWENILEESADVLVMICQIIHLTGQQPYMVRRRMDEKLDRQLQRIEEESGARRDESI